MTGIEPVTSSLPRKRSTPELHRPGPLSGRRDSNPRPSAWKADALPTELLPRLWGEQDSNLRRFPNGFTVRPRWPLEYPPGLSDSHLKSNIKLEPIVRFELTTPRLQITCSGQLSYTGILMSKTIRFSNGLQM
jgi:hypothetical protein